MIGTGHLRNFLKMLTISDNILDFLLGFLEILDSGVFHCMPEIFGVFNQCRKYGGTRIQKEPTNLLDLVQLPLRMLGLNLLLQPTNVF